MFAHRRGGKIIEQFSKLAAALREQDSRGIKLFGRLQSVCKRYVEGFFFRKLGGASGATSQVCFDRGTFGSVDFLASVENQKRRDV